MSCLYAVEMDLTTLQ